MRKYETFIKYRILIFLMKVRYSLCHRAMCVYLLPVATKKSSIIGNSWCAVVVGTRSGSVLFHNEEGRLLLRQNLFTQMVSSVCISVNSALQGYVYATSGKEHQVGNLHRLDICHMSMK